MGKDVNKKASPELIARADHKTTCEKPSSPLATAPHHSKFRMVVRVLLSLGISGVLLCLVYRNMDFGEAVEYIKQHPPRYDLLLLSVLIESFANVVRGLRWRLQMIPLGPPTVRRKVVIAAVMGCYTVNVALPRVGELWRCAVVSRSERVSLSAVLGTLITDRLMDFVMMILLFFLAIALFYSNTLELISQITLSSESLTSFFSSPWPYVLLAAILIPSLAFRKHLLSSSLWVRLRGFFHSFRIGLLTIVKMPHKWLFASYTLLLWLLYFIAFYMTFYAFSFTEGLGLGIGLLAFIMGTIGVAVPVQAGIGPWHFMVISTLTAFGVTAPDAGIFALIVHTVQIFGTAFVGLLAIFFVPLLGRKKQTTK